MSNSVIIRKAHARESAKIAPLIRRVIRGTTYYSEAARSSQSKKYSVGYVTKLFERKDFLCWIAVDKTETLGFLLGFEEANTCWLEWLGVDSRSRRKGIGNQLLEQAEIGVYKKGVRSIWCDSRTNNKESEALLAKRGYTKVGKLTKHFYGQDYFIWQKHL